MKKATTTTATKKQLATIVEHEINSTNYSKLIISPEINRMVIDTHVRKKMMPSISTFGFITFIVAVRTRLFGKIENIIIDGQNRYKAAMSLEQPINYIIIELEEDSRLAITQVMSALNSCALNWNNKNYVEIFSNAGSKSMKVIKDELVRTGLPMTDVLHIYTGSGKNEDFRKGEPKLLNVKDSKKLADAIVKVRAFLPNKSFSRRSVIKVMKTVTDYNSFADVIISETRKGKQWTENEKELKLQLEKLLTKFVKSKKITLKNREDEVNYSLAA